jgi:hypothetical protein
MKPDRSNYEIWLIDWLDGNLDEERTQQLMAFLDENPDLKEEAESLSVTRLEPERNGAMLKNRLKKTPSQLPLSQVEYLSIAYLENDLSNEQIKDLKENISVNSESRELFDIIQKTRLKPPDFRFINKKRLLKNTPAERILRLSVIGLSAAATITVLIISFILMPKLHTGRNEVVAVNSAIDTITIPQGIVLTVKSRNISKQEISDQTTGLKISIPKLTEVTGQPLAFVRQDSPELPERNPELLKSHIPSLSGAEINYVMPGTSLIASNIKTREPLYYDSERSRLGRFIASAFREKILKDKTYNDDPLKPYEIAEAGIEGLNKLLGWEMALVKTSDEEGELKSYYFSSKVLKFNAPVKKSNPVL